MTEAEVKSRLVTFADPTSEPVLSSTDLDVVMDMAKRVDEFGIRPADEGWTETYDVNYAIAQCWLIKAGRLANRYLFMSGGKMFSRNQYYEHCMALYHKYINKANPGSLRLVSGSLTDLELIPNNWNGPYS